jgi:phosphoadenosine phosphosulfate reductase
MPKQELTQTIRDSFITLHWQARLAMLKSYHKYNIAFSTSFGLQDQAIIHVIAQLALDIRIFTLDTGRLFEETHDVFARTQAAYPHLRIESYSPCAEDISALVAAQGANGFYQSREHRVECCHVRKVKPLTKALENVDIWISGLRHAQSDARQFIEVAEYDSSHRVVKLYPLLDVQDDELRRYIDDNNIPYNALHDKGFPSIGCAPCTRAVKEGEHPRSGRWWWEDASAQECGLHMVNGKLVRATDANR